MDNVLLGYADISSLTKDEALERLDEVPEFRRRKILSHKTEKGIVQSFGAGLLLDKMLKQQGIFRTDFTVADSGKPYLPGGIFFNISHSGKLAVCTLSQSEVGCDVEEILGIRNGALTGAFSDAEIKYIGDDPERFYALWTAKESYIKFSGATIASIKDISLSANVSCGQIEIKGAHITSGRINNYIYAVCSAAALPVACADYTEIILKKRAGQ